jgi:asparagine synthase (glutamine-hydrolysing)
MSAIAGVWSFDGGAVVAEACQQMLHALGIYGADHTAQYASAELAMGRCLSRLLPEDRFDHQPLCANDSVLVADLRLDNRRELIRQLGLVGAAGLADSALLMAAWQKWREQCVDHLLGAFSFAVWDLRERELFVARDHTGERPLYYFSSSNQFAFASMPKGLHTLGQVGAEIDEDYIVRYLSGINTPVEQTIFRRIVRLPPGWALTVRPGKTKIWRYWQREALPELRLSSDLDYLELFRECFDQAVASRLRTIGGIGAHLSGGMDSSSVASTAAKLLAQESRGLIAYTAVPRVDFRALEGPNFFDNEGPAAAQVAALYPNMRHELVDSSQSNFLDVLDLNNSLYDHPCYAPGNEVWLNAILTRARESSVTVLLNGSCGNSTLSYYGMPVLSAWFRSGRWLSLVKVAWQLKASRDASVKSIFRSALWPSLPFWLRRVTDPHMRGFTLDYCILHPDLIQRFDSKRRALRDLNTDSTDGRSMLSALLTYGDISDSCIAPQGGWGIDYRDPTFDRRVVEFCLTVPLEQFVRGGKLRSLVRRAMAERLPPSTLNRRQRGRQAADWYLSMTALRGRMRRELDRLQCSPLASRMLDLARMRSLIENWPTTGFERLDIEASYHTALARGFSVGKFLMNYDPQARGA